MEARVESMDADMMQAAVNEGVKGVKLKDGGPFGAVVVKDGHIVSHGHNMVLSSLDPTAHAEVTAIRKACEKLRDFDLSGCLLYTSCFPCPMCLGACLWARIDKVLYAATPQDAASAGFDDKAFYEFLKSDGCVNAHMCKVERLTVDGYMCPFEQWSAAEDKRQY